MSIADKPHYEITANDLAEWLERQGLDRWWTVDGDRVLTGMLPFPSPVEELVEAIRRVNRPLLVRDWSESPGANGQRVDASRLDQVAGRLGGNGVSSRASDRFLQLSWKDDDHEWLLIEDEESTALARAEAHNQRTDR